MMTFARFLVISLLLANSVHAADFLYVTMSDNTVARFDISSANPLTIAASKTTFATGFDSPRGLAFDTAGNLFVANNGNGTVSKVGPEGGVATTWATGYVNPIGLTIDAIGNVYAANFGNDTVSRVGTTGGVATSWATGYSNPTGLAFDTASNLYAGNILNGRTRKVGPSGGIASDWAVSTNPTGLAFDSAGNLYISNSGDNGTIMRVGPEGGNATNWSTGHNSPSGLAFDSNGYLYVADQLSQTIRKIDSLGEVVFSFEVGSITPRFLTIVSVPEPSTFMLAGIAALSLVILANRRTRQ